VSPIDLDRAEARLTSDPASVKTRSWMDRLRVWRLARDSRVTIGDGVVIKPGVEFRLTDNARLIVGDFCTIDTGAYLQLTKPYPTIRLGRYVGIGRHNVLAAKTLIEIGDFTQLGPYCQINDQGHGVAANDLIINQAAVLAPVRIGRDCWLGSGVRVLPGVAIGDGAVIGAGSVVTHDVPAYQIWAGVPARFLKNRE
jgi:acetyltransferase-like isoleucine patch superfamily enzyme